MVKKCKPLWREADFEVKTAKTDICKTHHVRSTFGRSTAPHYTKLQIRYNTTATTTAATTPLYYTHSTSPHFSTLHHHCNYNCNDNYDYNGYYSYSYNYNITTTTTSTTATTTMQPQLQLQLQKILCTSLHYLYTTLHPAVVVEVTTAAATTPKSTNPTTFRSIKGFALPSMHHNNSPPL